jgi:hypothetical protein
VVDLSPGGIITGFYPGSTTLIATTVDGGYSDSCIVIVPGPSSSDLERDREGGPAAIRILPNPSAGAVKIESREEITGLELYTLAGEMILNRIHKVHPGEELLLPQLDEGIYLVKLFMNDDIYVDKIIIQR